jgi:hypothetical protein
MAHMNDRTGGHESEGYKNEWGLKLRNDCNLALSRTLKEVASPNILSRVNPNQKGGMSTSTPKVFST